MVNVPLAHFSALFPDIDVRLNASYPAAPDLLKGAADIDIRYGMDKLLHIQYLETSGGLAEDTELPDLAL